MERDSHQGRSECLSCQNLQAKVNDEDWRKHGFAHDALRCANGSSFLIWQGRYAKEGQSNVATLSDCSQALASQAQESISVSEMTFDFFACVLYVAASQRLLLLFPFSFTCRAHSMQHNGPLTLFPFSVGPTRARQRMSLSKKVNRNRHVSRDFFNPLSRSKRFVDIPLCRRFSLPLWYV